MPKEKKHPFSAEMRIRVNKRIHPNITAEEVKSFVRRILRDGEEIKGIEVKAYNVRGENKRDDLLSISDDYGFSASFITGASRSKTSKAKS